MKIDLQVENKMLTNPDFLAVLYRACWQLSQPRMLKMLCLHEVGHLIYFEPIRAIMGPDTPKLRFVGPTITYDDSKRQFAFMPAAIQTPFIERGLRYDDEVMGHITRGAVAGGVFLEEFEHLPNGGDDEDNFVFNMHFGLARNQSWTPKHSKNKMWTDAQTEVRLHLKEQLFKELVLERTAKLEAEHFSIRDN